MMEQEHVPVPKLVARRISSMIADGELLAGAKLPSQRDLSQQFGVSRTSVREAISLLEASGTLRTEPGRGMFVGRGEGAPTVVNGQTDGAVYSKLDLCRFRYMIEGQTARLAAMRVTDQNIEALDRNLQRFKAQTRAMDLHAAATTDFAFHHLVVGYAGVQIFTDLHASYRPLLIGMIEMPRSLYNRAWEPVVEHERIIEALKRRDPDEARYYMESHIVRSSERLGIMLADDVV
jgi:GntR family transcriptional regulator, transcriptional repressor for pyruvate dehydrogenase complex